MNRIFSSIDNMFVTVYYAAIFLTPSNVRGAARVIGTLGSWIADCGSRIAGCGRAACGRAPHTALILCAAMLAPAPSSGRGSQSATSDPQPAHRRRLASGRGRIAARGQRGPLQHGLRDGARHSKRSSEPRIIRRAISMSRP